MKRTTKIFIGIYLAGIVIIVAGFSIAFLSARKVDYDRGLFQVGNGETETLELNTVRAVKVMVVQPDSKFGMVGTNGQLRIIAPSDKLNRDKITHPQSKFVKINQLQDTLNIVLDLNHQEVREAQAKDGFLYASGLNITLEASPLLAYIQNKSDLSIIIEKTSLDRCVLETSRAIHLDSAIIGTLDISNSDIHLDCRNSMVEELYANMKSNRVRHLNFEDSKVHSMYLAGKDRSHISVSRTWCDKLYWVPEAADANLTVVLTDPVEIAFK